MKLLARLFSVATFLALSCFALNARETDSLNWHSKENRVDAEINNCQLPQLLQKLSTATGWQVYLEPGTTENVSVKFKNLPTDEALHRLLGRVNYAKIETNSISKLFVYRSSAGAATQLIPRDDPAAFRKKDYRIPNELLVRINCKSGAKIEDFLPALKAKVIGRNDSICTYRLQFSDEASANAARDLLKENDKIADVDSNYVVERPSPADLKTTTPGSSSGDPFGLDPKKPADGSVVIGLIDTGVQLDSTLKNYSLQPVSVAGQSELPSDVPTHGTGMFDTILTAMHDSPAKIQPVDVYGRGESTTTFEVVNGIIYAVNAGANPINLSLGATGDSEMLHDLITRASQKGILFIAAAGNVPTTSPTFPAAYPEVLAVTSVDSSGKPLSYANRGGFIDVGVTGISTVMLNNQPWMMSGTSVSTAYASGAIAQLLVQHQPMKQAVESFVRANAFKP